MILCCFREANMLLNTVIERSQAALKTQLCCCSGAPDQQVAQLLYFTIMTVSQIQHNNTHTERNNVHKSGIQK